MRRAWLGLVALALVFVPATPAQAHASLLASTPAAGYSVSHSPAQLTLVFDEPVGLRGTALRVSGPGGAVALAAPRLSNGDRWLTADVTRPLANGQYEVSWQVVAEDGDVVGGSYSFAVGVAAPASSGHTATRGLLWAALFRWTLFGALAIALGGLVGQRIAARVISKAAAVGARLPAVRAPVALAAGVGAVAAIGLSAHVLGSGNLASGIKHLSIPALWASSAGRVSAVEVAAFAAAAGLAATRRRIAGAAVLPLLVVVAAEGQRSHLREADGAAGIALLIVHLTAAAIWLGALSHVMAVAWTWRANRAAAHRVLAEYARLALVLLLLVALTGTVSATLALPSVSALTATGYGRLLMAKMALVAVAVGCAVAGRRRLRRERDRGRRPRPGTRPRARRRASARTARPRRTNRAGRRPGGHRRARVGGRARRVGLHGARAAAPAHRTDRATGGARRRGDSGRHRQ